MTELPDFKKIEFPSTPAIPLKDIVPDAPPEVRLDYYSLSLMCSLITGSGLVEENAGVQLQAQD